MKHFSIANNTNCFFGLMLQQGDIYGCLEISTKHRNYRHKMVLSEKPRQMLYVVQDFMVHVTKYDDYTAYYFKAWYAEKPKNPTDKPRWQQGLLHGSVLLEKLNNGIMEYVKKFRGRIVTEILSNTDNNGITYFTGDNMYKGVKSAEPHRREVQKEYTYKRYQINTRLDDTDVKPRIPHVTPMYANEKEYGISKATKKALKDKNSNK